jgi:hypothetical protein
MKTQRKKEDSPTQRPSLLSNKRPGILKKQKDMSVLGNQSRQMGSELRQGKPKRKKTEDPKVLSQNYSCRSLHSSGAAQDENASRNCARPRSGKTPCKATKRKP